MKTHTHPVRLLGFWNNEQEIPYEIKSYGDHRDSGELVKSRPMEKYSKFIGGLSKPTITIVDFGGGAGKGYTTLKYYTNRSFNYNIIDLPGVSGIESPEVKYFDSSNCAEIKTDVDVFFTDATFYLTKQRSFLKNIDDACKFKPLYMIFHRNIICEGGNYDSFYTYVPAFGHRYNILKEDYFLKVMKSYDYELIEKDYTFTRPNPEERITFAIQGSPHGEIPNDLGKIFYKQYIFKKVERVHNEDF